MGREPAPISSFLVSKLFGACNFKEFEIVLSFMDLENLETVDAVMAALGGNGPVAAITSSKPSAISMWRKAKRFPTNQHLVMVAALHAIGKTAPPTLWGMKLPADAEHAA